MMNQSDRTCGSTQPSQYKSCQICCESVLRCIPRLRSATRVIVRSLLLEYPKLVPLCFVKPHYQSRYAGRACRLVVRRVTWRGAQDYANGMHKLQLHCYPVLEGLRVERRAKH
jgi:hypothetical protein